MINYFGSRYSNRLRYANKLLKIDPNNIRGLRYLAWTYWLMGNKSKALEIYQKIKKLDANALETVFKNQPEIKKNWDKREPLTSAYAV